MFTKSIKHDKITVIKSAYGSDIMGETIEGKCMACGKTFSKLSMKKHLDKCSKLAVDTHDCGEEMLLPVINSPRVGTCAYSGGICDE